MKNTLPLSPSFVLDTTDQEIFLSLLKDTKRFKKKRKLLEDVLKAPIIMQFL